ncbi:MAG: helix-hairpin-helix domain-containing protein [Armatimonadetes bacterium]|nr:helix-hairpin-helix domain-containing protein [Armatimonadota bacterium]
MFGLDFTAKQKLAAFALIGLSAIGLSIVFARNSGALGGGVTLREPSGSGQAGVITYDSDPIGGSSDSSGSVVVHVAGAVATPNVYTLPRGKRIIDAVKAAGGALPDADLQSLNLAEKLVDGSKIFVPSKSQAQPNATPQAYMPFNPTSETPPTDNTTSESPTKKSSKSNKFKNPGDGVVSINSASIEELQRLPGVGPVTAQKIVDYRKQIGAYKRPDQLKEISGIGPKKFEKMQPFVKL